MHNSEPVGSDSGGGVEAERDGRARSSLRWSECIEEAREVFSLLEESETLELARERLAGYIDNLDWAQRMDIDWMEPWDHTLFKDAVLVLRNLISTRCERLAGFSTLELLWTAARRGNADISEGFIEELTHLFRALRGRAGVYPSRLTGGEEVDFDRLKGREGAMRRSDFLDAMADHMDEYIARYPSGLAADVVELRAASRRSVLDRLGATEEDWQDWQWQYRNVLKDLAGLRAIQDVVELEPDQVRAIELALEGGVPFGITPYYLHLMDPVPSERDHAVRRQVLPPLDYVEKMVEHRDDRSTAFDFMRERDTTPVDLVTRRYSRVAIVKPYDSCPQICVYCQRNWEIEEPMMESALAPKEAIEGAVQWFAEHERMMDVLVTGGDPLVMSDSLVESLLSRFSDIPHVRSIRIATRTPVTVPQRFTDALCEILASYDEPARRTIYVVTHFSHPYEITPESAAAVHRIRDHGMSVYNQQVFTFANSRRFETAALRIAMKDIGVDPYYTFNMKGKSEIMDYAAPIARILQERKEEARLLPGIYRTDEPVFNVPLLGKNHLRAMQDHELIAIRPDGRRVYTFQPWERNIARVRPYVYTDVSIRGYLERLEDRGEDLEDYKSIWYYH